MDVADLDGNGKDEVYVTLYSLGAGAGALMGVQCTGELTDMTTENSVFMVADAGGYGLTIGDIDNNGKTDIYTSAYKYGKVISHEFQGGDITQTLNYTATTFAEHSTANGSCAIMASQVDIDGDGAKELAVAYLEGGASGTIGASIYENVLEYTTIYDIQYNETVPGEGDDCYPSTMIDSLVKIRGTVLGADGHGFYVQDASNSWNGIYVHTTDRVANLPEINDSVMVIGNVGEYKGLTEIVNPTVINLGQSDFTIEPVELSTGLFSIGCDASAEAHEGTLVKLTNVTVTQEANQYGIWHVDDGTGSCVVDDYMFHLTPEIGTHFDFLVGVVRYSYGEYGVNPRIVSDFSPEPVWTVTFRADLTDFIANDWFDPSDPADSIVVNGDFNGWNSSEKMVPDETNPNIYVHTEQISAGAGEIFRWKFRIFPGTKWLNTGWELDANREMVFTGADMILDPEVPNCEYAGEPISQDVTVTFSVDMSTYSGEYSNVSLQGETSPLNWTPGTTIMSDPEGDEVYTVDILFTAGTGKNIVYKYTAQTNPWNWEPIGDYVNRCFEIDDSSPTQVLEVDQWGILPGIGSAYFDGANDRIRVSDAYPVNPDANPSAYIITGNTITVEAWVFPMSLPAYNDGKVILSRPYWNMEPWFAYELKISNWGATDNPRFQFCITDGTVPMTGAYADDTSPVTMGTWTHLAGTYDGSMVRLYVNGQLTGEIPFTADIPEGNTGLYLGGLSHTYFHGLIDDVRLWNVARTQQEIQDNMNIMLAGNESGLAGYWPLNESTTVNDNYPVTIDLSSNHNDLWVQYGAYFVSAVPPDGEPVIAPDFYVEELYGVIGEYFEYRPKVGGWSVPTISIINAPTGMVIDNGVLKWTPDVANRHEITLEAANNAGTVQESFTMWVDAAPLHHKAHDNNSTLYSIFNNGILGKNRGEDGEGFQFNGLNGLFEGDLLIAQSVSQVSGKLYEREYGILDTIKSISSSLSGFDRAYETKFDDQRAPNPIGVEIIQRSHSKSTSPDDDYVIMDYDVLNNTGSDLNGIYIGLEMDWDVGSAANNLGGYDSQRKLSYVYEATEGQSNPNYYGMTVLSGDVSGHFLWTIGSVEDEGLDNFLYQSMQSFSGIPTEPSDLRVILAMGPYSITAGSSVRAVFAILGGTDLAGLQANADAALAIDLEGEIPELSHFSPIYTGNPYLAMNIYITGATIDGIGLSAGDEIGIFDGEYCVGAGWVTGAIDPYLALVASTDDPGTTEIDGFTPGHAISYRLWDSGEELEIANVVTTYTMGDGTFSSQGTAMVNLEGLMTVEQDIGLNTGWNIMSFYAEPEDMNLQSIVQPQIDNSSLLKIQDETGAAIEELPIIGWINNIGDMSVSEGYYIKVNSNQVLTLEGNPVDLPIDITLDAGWNIMGYPVASAQDAMNALQPLVDAGDLLKVQDETGAAIEELPVIGWVNNIGNFEPDEGYYVKVASSTSISLNEPSKLARIAVVSESENSPTHFVTSFEGNPYLAMNIYVLKATLDDIAVKAGTEIGVFYRGLCVGTAALTRSLEPDDSYLSIIVSTDDPLTEEVDGFVPGRSVSFRLWDGKDEYTMSATACSEDEDLKALRFESQGTIVVELTGKTLPKEYRLYSCYPNPFNPTTTIRYDLPNDGHVKLLVYDLQGRLMRTLVSEQREAGYQSVIWDGRDDNGSMLPSGMYFYQLSAGSFSQVKKMALVK